MVDCKGYCAALAYIDQKIIETLHEQVLYLKEKQGDDVVMAQTKIDYLESIKDTIAVYIGVKPSIIIKPKMREEE